MLRQIIPQGFQISQTAKPVAGTCKFRGCGKPFITVARGRKYCDEHTPQKARRKAQ